MQHLRQELRLRLAAGLLLAASLAGCATGATPAPDRDGRWLRFSCDSGHAVQARYAADARTVMVRRDDREYLMTLARSASGARYAGDSLEWWTKGSGAGATGMLLRHGADGGPGELLDRCTQQQ